MTSPTLLRLPARPITVNVKPGVIGTPRGTYFAAVILFLLAVGFLWMGIPNILKDLTINQNPVSVNSDIRNGQCKAYKGILTSCSADVYYTYQRQSYQKHVEFMFVNIYSGDYETNTVISGDHPELATLQLGLDYLWDRIITQVVFVVLLGGGCILSIYNALRFAAIRKKYPILLR